MYIPTPHYKAIVEVLPILCVDLLIIHNSRCLLLKRTNEPALGQYWFPGGRVRKNESIAEAAIRISKAETGLDCIFKEQVSVEETMFEKAANMDSDVHTVNICCTMEVVSTLDCLKPDRFHDDFKWVDKLSGDFHDGVKHPLSKIGFGY